MKTHSLALLGSMLVAGIQPALAQSATDVPASAEAAPAQAAEPAQSCELHVWPGRSFHTVYYGWAHGGTIDGAQKGRNGYPAMPDQPLSVEVQRGLLGRLDIPAILGLQGYRTVMHEAPLDAAAIRTAPGRQLAASGPCYAELMIDDIVFQNHVINGKWLNVIMRYRQFEGTSQTPQRSYGTYITARASLFPPAPDTDPQPALEELRSAYSQAINEFGKQYAAHLKRNGKKKAAAITL